MDSEDEVIRIVLLGTTGAGKSSTGNLLLRMLDVFPVGSKTSMVSLTDSCSIGAGKNDGRQINVIDTPGFLNTEQSEEYISDEIRDVISLASPGPHVFLIVHNCTEKFTPAKVRSTNTLKTILGENMMERTVLILTGHNIDNDIERKCIDTFKNHVGAPRGWFALNEEDGKENKEYLANMLFRRFGEYALTNPQEYYKDPAGQFEKAYKLITEQACERIQLTGNTIDHTQLSRMIWKIKNSGDDEGAIKPYEMSTYESIVSDNKEPLAIAMEKICGFRQFLEAGEKNHVKKRIHACNIFSAGTALIGNVACIVGNLFSMPSLIFIGAATSVVFPGIFDALVSRKEPLKKDERVFSKFFGEMSKLKEELFKPTKQPDISMYNITSRGTPFRRKLCRMVGSAMPAALYSVFGWSKTEIHPSLNETSKKIGDSSTYSLITVLRVASLAASVFIATLALTDLINLFFQCKREGEALRIMVKELKREQKMLHEDPANFLKYLHQKRTGCDRVRRSTYRNQRSSLYRNTFQNILAKLVPHLYQDPMIYLLHIFTPLEIKTKSV